jgi:reactive intermediate/imine deaminase
MSTGRVSNVFSGKPWERRVQFSQCFRVEAGPLIFLSGQASIDSEGEVVGKGDMTVQARTTFANIRDLLVAAGSSMDDVVKLTCFVTDIARWPEVQKVRAEFFPHHHPTSTSMQITRLQREEMLIEIEAIAAPSSSTKL